MNVVNFDYCYSTDRISFGFIMSSAMVPFLSRPALEFIFPAYNFFG